MLAIKICCSVDILIDKGSLLRLLSHGKKLNLANVSPLALHRVMRTSWNIDQLRFLPSEVVKEENLSSCPQEQLRNLYNYFKSLCISTLIKDPLRKGQTSLKGHCSGSQNTTIPDSFYTLRTSEKRITSLQKNKTAEFILLSPKCPLFGGSTVSHICM